ncbi:MAG: iron-sulfur cluster assembly scaffold protein [Candidatus Eisenbacteria bacterium]|nr:iron-sulfur cluster assembly scaffold protein [Candidatus Eisenbacteria bacterium]
MGWDYSEKTKKLFMDAVKGVPGTHLGEIEDPDGLGEHGSIACGDALRFTFRVDRHPSDPTKDVIVEARYLTFGCTSAIAASEALCRLIEEKKVTPIEALAIKNQDIVDYVDGLPEQKIHCSVMGAEALQAAVFNWAQKRGVDLGKLGIDILPEEQDEGRMVCKCFGLTEPYIRRKIKELNLRSIPQITNAIKAGGACMTCHHTPGGLQDILDDVWGKEERVVIQSGDFPIRREAAPSASGFSDYQLGKMVEKTIDEEVRPTLHKDGGDIEIVDIKGTMVYARLTGACETCAIGDRTLHFVVERALKEKVDERIRVIAV